MVKVIAFNERTGSQVKWLGYTSTKDGMRKRLREYHAPSHIRPLEVWHTKREDREYRIYQKRAYKKKSHSLSLKHLNPVRLRL